MSIQTVPVRFSAVRPVLNSTDVKRHAFHAKYGADHPECKNFGFFALDKLTDLQLLKRTPDEHIQQEICSLKPIAFWVTGQDYVDYVALSNQGGLYISAYQRALKALFQAKSTASDNPAGWWTAKVTWSKALNDLYTQVLKPIHTILAAKVKAHPESSQPLDLDNVDTRSA